jgi:hypothetical protein
MFCKRPTLFCRRFISFRPPLPSACIGARQAVQCTVYSVLHLLTDLDDRLIENMEGAVLAET